MNRGAEQLKNQLSGHGKQREFVGKYNEGLEERDRIDDPTLSRWINGKRIPLTLQLRRIEDLTKIPMRDWTEAASENGGSPTAAE